MELHDVWPMQRANVRRRKMSVAERELRQRVRQNKKIAASKATARRQKEERAERAKQRAHNHAIIHANKRALAK